MTKTTETKRGPRAGRRPSLSKSDKIQEVFLNHCRREQVEVKVEGRGDSARGVIAGFDRDSIVLERDQSQMIFYKNQIYRITPCEQVNCIFSEPPRSLEDPNYGQYYFPSRMH